MAKLQFARRERFCSDQQLNQRGFAGAVHANESDAVAALDDEADITEDFLLTVTFSDLLKLRYDAAARLRLREGEMDGLLFRRDFDPLHSLQFFDAALHLLGLGCLIAKAVDKDLQLLDALALIAVGGLKLLVPLRLL